MNRKIPLRKCVVTQEMKPKKELIRIVRSKEGEVSIDPSGKKSGRGAYLTKSVEVVKLAQQKNTLEQQLNAKIDTSLYDELIAFIEKDPT
ncbi:MULTISPECIES: RNase P modulator RnpM [unclassified Bacillus (in: firmicutes)]|uniref:RNase P modulator RnpM n=1 Tax=unclassified Bacillus (in: firmicutes) TaxID=185979 RepID=UPI000BEF8187|nr:MULTISPECIES: YlxR family protein [unclassified Bacillus (in: firmicutes)]PEJ60216.1 RNA-binding protein [Bacillus sp. AFS002410]PEL10769.1 RNA-binding protein [Bacillus sp. AFS017336]